MEELSCRSTEFFFPQKTGKIVSMKQQKWTKELLVTNAESYPWKKGIQGMLTLLDVTKKAAIPAKCVLFDSWLSSPNTLHVIKNIGYDVNGMVKKIQKLFFLYNDEDIMSLTSICNKNKKRRGKSRYLFFVMVDVVKDVETIPAKVAYVYNRNKCKEYLCLISTDVNLDENEIVRIYGKRWDIEVFSRCVKVTLT